MLGSRSTWPRRTTTRATSRRPVVTTRIPWSRTASTGKSTPIRSGPQAPDRQDYHDRLQMRGGLRDEELIESLQRYWIVRPAFPGLWLYSLKTWARDLSLSQGVSLGGAWERCDSGFSYAGYRNGDRQQTSPSASIRHRYPALSAESKRPTWRSLAWNRPKSGRKTAGNTVWAKRSRSAPGSAVLIDRLLRIAAPLPCRHLRPAGMKTHLDGYLRPAGIYELHP